MGRSRHLHTVVIELSESGLHPGLAKELRSLGQRFAMDDVGTGTYQLAAVVADRPDFIKLDRTLVPGILADQGKQALVQPLVSCASRWKATSSPKAWRPPRKPRFCERARRSSPRAFSLADRSWSAICDVDRANLWG